MRVPPPSSLVPLMVTRVPTTPDAGVTELITLAVKYSQRVPACARAPESAITTTDPVPVPSSATATMCELLELMNERRGHASSTTASSADAPPSRLDPSIVTRVPV
jgi:hypothetical protein